MFKQKSKKEMAFDIINICIMCVVCFIILYPIWYCLVMSFNNGQDAMLGGIYWFPRKFTLDNYLAVFADIDILRAFGVSVVRTILATAAHVVFTAMVAYALSKKYLMGRKAYVSMGVITLFFSGGMIPTFLLVRELGLYDNFLVYILLPMFSFYDAVIFMNFFRGIPVSIEEAAKIDGAGDYYIFFRIILPLSGAVLATIILFNGVYNWNDYFMGVIYFSDSKFQPIQTYLYKIISQSSSHQMMQNVGSVTSGRSVTSASVKMATMIVTTFPIVCVYPFLQKYFVKGMLIGSVKE